MTPPWSFKALSFKRLARIGEAHMRLAPGFAQGRRRSAHGLSRLGAQRGHRLRDRRQRPPAAPPAFDQRVPEPSPSPSPAASASGRAGRRRAAIPRRWRRAGIIRRHRDVLLRRIGLLLRRPPRCQRHRGRQVDEAHRPAMSQRPAHAPAIPARTPRTGRRPARPGRRRRRRAAPPAAACPASAA